MSFILDALRKSENARQRHGGPALAEVPIARRRENKQWWIAAVVALLLINVVVLAVVLIRDNDEPVPAAAAPVAATPIAPAAVPPTVVATPAPAPAVTAPMQAAPAPNPVVANAPPATGGHSLAEEAAGAVDLQSRDIDAPPNANSVAGNVPDRAPIVQALNPNAAPGTAQGPNENLPTLNELTGDRAVNMPAMHLDIHVYSEKPAERFVFINMRKYTEGATLTEGPVVERIRTDGVVLNQKGFRFVLPRQ